MTAALLAAPPAREPSLILEPGVRPAARSERAEPEETFERALRKAREPAEQDRGPRAEQAAASDSVEPDDDADAAGTADPDADTATNTAPPDVDGADARPDVGGAGNDSDADSAPQAQDSPPPGPGQERSGRSSSRPERGAAPADETPRPGVTAQPNRGPDASRDAGASASAAAIEGAGERVGRAPGPAIAQGPKSAAPPVQRAVIDAPPTVHRINELLLTLDARALSAAGVKAGPVDVAGETAPTVAAANTDDRLRDPRHTPPSTRATPFRFAEVASEDAAAKVERSGDSRLGEFLHRREQRSEPAPVGAEAAASRPRATGSGSEPASASSATTAASVAPHRAGGLDRAEAGARSALRLDGAGAPRVAATPAGGTAGGASTGAGGEAAARDAGLAASKASAPRAQTPDAARPDQPFQAQVSRGLAAAIAQRGGRVTLRLAPQSLGELRIDLAVKEGAVSARFQATTAEARELLTSSMEHLREVLHAKGLQVDRLEVREQAEPPRSAGTPQEAQRETEADGGAESRHGQSREDPGDDKSRRQPNGAGRGGRGEDAAEAASDRISGSPEDAGASVWRIAIDAVA